MAIEDRIIPVLTGETAERFIANAEAAEERARKRKTSDTRLRDEAIAILKKSGMM